MPIMRFLILFLFLTGGALSAEKEWVLVFDATKHMFPVEDELSDIEPFERIPVISNFPFLKLHAGDRIVKAARAPQGKGLITGKKWVGYYLFTGDQRFHLSVREKEGGLELYDPSQTILFAWEFSDAHADAIRDNLIASYLERTMDQEGFSKVLDVVRREFPDSQVSSPSFALPPSSRRLPGQSFREYNLVAIGRRETSIAEYQLRIGPAILLLHKHVLIRGPERVDPLEFEDRPASAVINVPPPSLLSPAEKKEKKEAYDRMVRFRKIVSEALDSK